MLLPARPSNVGRCSCAELHCHLLAVVRTPCRLLTSCTYCRPTSHTATSKQDLLIGHTAATACCGICVSLRAAVWAGTSGNILYRCTVARQMLYISARCLQGCRIKGKAEKAVFNLKVGRGSVPCGVWAAFAAVLRLTTVSLCKQLHQCLLASPG